MNLNKTIWDTTTLTRHVVVNRLALDGQHCGYVVRRDYGSLGVGSIAHNVNTLDIDGDDYWDWTMVGAITKKINRLNEEIKSLEDLKAKEINYERR